jgi:hypothetical protein
MLGWPRRLTRSLNKAGSSTQVGSERVGRLGGCSSVRPMSELVRLGDAFALRTAFLGAAKLRYPDDQLTGILWYCASCGASLMLANLLIDEDLRPACPEAGCTASGWELIGPATHLYD